MISTVSIGRFGFLYRAARRVLEFAFFSAFPLQLARVPAYGLAVGEGAHRFSGGQLVEAREALVAHDF